jgi:hypothetical protein
MHVYTDSFPEYGHERHTVSLSRRGKPAKKVRSTPAEARIFSRDHSVTGRKLPPP